MSFDEVIEYPDTWEPFEENKNLIDLPPEMECKMFKVYNIASDGRTEINLAIVNEKKGKMILTDKDGVHTLHDITKDEKITSKFTTKKLLESEPLYEIEKLTDFIRHFGSRIESNYSKLLKSIKQIGLNKDDEVFKRSSDLNRFD